MRPWEIRNSHTYRFPQQRDETEKVNAGTRNLFERCKPATPKPILLIVAGSLWAFAGGMLAFRGYALIVEGHADPLLFALAGAGAGVVFFIATFRAIADRYIARILTLQSERPCFFSLFSLRGYVTMAFMIGLGVTLRSISAIPRDDLGGVYFVIAVPLLFSSVRFIRTGFSTNSAVPSQEA